MNSGFLKNLFVWFIIFASLMGAYQILSEGKKNTTEIQYSEFLSRVDSGEVLEVEIKGNQINGQYIHINGSGGTVYFETYGPAGDDLLKQICFQKKIIIKHEPR